MPEALNRGALRLGITHHGLALLQQHGWPKRRLRLLDSVALDAQSELAPQLAPAVEALVARCNAGGRPLRVLLADDLVRLWTVTPPRNAGGLADLRAAAEARFQTLYGEPAEGWRDGRGERWQMAADWRAGQAFLACALPRALATAITQAAAAQQLTLLELQPQFVAAWNRWRGTLGTGEWLGVVHAGMLTLAVVAGGRLQTLRRLPAPSPGQGGSAGEWLRGTVAQEALRLSLPRPSAVRLCGSVPGAWTRSLGAAGERDDSGDGWACSVLDSACLAELADEVPAGLDTVAQAEFDLVEQVALHAPRAAGRDHDHVDRHGPEAALHHAFAASPIGVAATGWAR